MQKVLIIIPFYFPGYRVGGPQRTIENVVDFFSDSSDIYIYTKNHDMGDDTPYDVETNKWVKHKGAKIMYVPDAEYYGKTFEKMYMDFDIIYSCSLFSRNSIHLMILHKKKKCLDKKVYIAPMGVLDKGAFSSKKIKKKVFVNFCNLLGLFENIIWSFTSNNEKDNAIKVLGEKSVSKFVIAEDLPRKIDFDKYMTIRKQMGTDVPLRICFISRICPKKNLTYALDILHHDYGRKIIFDIYGIIENSDYYKKCENMISNMTNTVKVNYCNQLDPSSVVDTFSKYDLFLFPTKGENFGHVIYEALAAGCIPVISDRTPWDDLEEMHCGAVRRLEDKNSFISAIEQYVNMSNEELMVCKKNAIAYAEQKLITSVQNSGYKKVFEG